MIAENKILNIKKRIEKLRKIINKARYYYHVLDKSIMPDSVLDSLKHELYKLEQKYPQFITPDSPTQRVAGKPLKGFKKVFHKIPMLSIEDIFSVQELKEWQEYIKRLIGDEKIEYFAELKIDGFGISLVYKNGILNCGSTRGTGTIGEDVTQNLKTIESIPLRLEIHGKLPTREIEEKVKKLIKKGEIEIRGEVYMTKKDFERINKELAKKGERTYSNPRNLAAGSIRQLDPKLAASRPLKFLAYDIITDLGQKYHSQEHQILPILGFKTDKGKICKDLNEVIEFWQNSAKIREKLPFQIDGVVVNVNSNSLFQKLGIAGKSPRGARALKFSPKKSTTILKNVVFQVGRTGAITPVAVLKPLELEGVVITRATLHNEDEIKRLGVKIGDTVIVERAGDVIPAVSGVLKELRTGNEKEINFPKYCPVCHTKLVKKKEEAVWRCPNKNCPGRKRRFLYNFCSKKAFDIEGLGHKVIDQLVDQGLISNPADIFDLKEGDLLPLERFAEKSAKNLIESIQKAKKITLPKFIFSLGIRNVGEKTAYDLARIFKNIDNLKSASLEKLESIPDIGPICAKSIYNWFRDKNNLALLERLKKAGVEIIEEKIKPSKKIKGKKFVITGTLKSMSREAAKEKIKHLGGDFQSTVSKNTDYLIVGKNPGSKLEKAKKLNVKIISEEEFLKMIK